MERYFSYHSHSSLLSCLSGTNGLSILHKCSGFNTTKLCLLFPTFDVKFESFVTYDKSVSTMKWTSTSLVSKNTKIRRQQKKVRYDWLLNLIFLNFCFYFLRHKMFNTWAELLKYLRWSTCIEMTRVEITQPNL